MDNIGTDVIYGLTTNDLRVSYPFLRELCHLLWHSVSKTLINAVNIKITDGRNNIVPLNGLNVALSIIVDKDHDEDF